MRELELYVHIPFCVRKCRYCDFLSAPASAEQQERYTEVLIEEIQNGLPAGAPWDFSTDDAVVTSVFFGGGTPSLLPAEKIAEILYALRSEFRFGTGKETPEVTIECNPGTVDRQKLETYKACGINRLSFGLQSADEKELKALGRIHTWEMFLQSYELARETGFTNINVDLISALPGQSVSSWERTLEKVIALKPEHISAYSLIIEGGTPFYDLYHEDDLIREAGEQPRYLPSEEEERQMYVRTKELLSKAGFSQYEISNYAMPGYECRHNIGYWTGTEYLGFGLGSSSLVRAGRETHPPVSEEICGVRFKNPSESENYEFLVREGRGGRKCSGKEADVEMLTREDEMSEFMILGLRMTAGISEEEFLKRFGRPVGEVYGETVERLISLGLLKREDGRIALTARGLDVSNPVMAEFM